MMRMISYVLLALMATSWGMLVNAMETKVGGKKQIVRMLVEGATGALALAFFWWLLMGRRI